MRCKRVGLLTMLFKVLFMAAMCFATMPLSVHAAVDSYEPDDNFTIGSLIEVGVAQDHTLEVVGCEDWVTFLAIGGIEYVLETTGDTDTYLKLVTLSSRTVIKMDDDSGDNTNARISWVCPTTGVYYANVTGTYGDTGDYSLLLTSAGSWADNLDESLYFPHVASGSNWETEIGIINTGGTALQGVVSGYNSTGKLVEAQEVNLEANARLQLTVGSDFLRPTNIAYLKFEYTSAASCQGYEKFYIDGQRVAIPAVSTINSDTIYVSHIASNVNWWTGIALVNTTDEDKTLLFTFNDNSKKFLTIEAGRHWSGTVADNFLQADGATVESATITNASGIIGLELFGSTAESGNSYLSGILLSDQTTNTLYYPHVASDSNWWTGIVSYNPTSATSLVITPYSTAGEVLTPSSVDIAEKSKYVGAVSELHLPIDTAWFKVETANPITGFELFGKHDGSQLAGYSAVNIKTKQGAFVKVDHQGWTGISYVNTEAETATVTLTALNDSGAVIASNSMQLVGYGKHVGLSQAFFGGNDISEATYITFSSDKELVGFQLNSSDDDMMLDGLPGIVTVGLPDGGLD